MLGCDEVTAGVENVDSSVCDGDESSDGGGFVKNNEIEETFWDDDYVNGIRHMYEGVIYESNGKNCRQGVAIIKKYKQENNAVKELINDKGDVIGDTDGILDIEYSFYKNLYSCVNVDNVKMEEFISSIDVKINENDKDMCDAEILYDEITEALMAMSKKQKSWYRWAYNRVLL
ncbi:Hypothetical predicted protein [Mytilus galloprovincialis]|uniref:Uncharacterized protein n=1 Tax=Mytilus galloprovincialis TaxID=29158 RepID=A0A8B6GVK5_MYTGA|nr:Hypothetical predicted protein [Mytilus galloprovincialis]